MLPENQTINEIPNKTPDFQLSRLSKAGLIVQLVGSSYIACTFIITMLAISLVSAIFESIPEFDFWIDTRQIDIIMSLFFSIGGVVTIVFSSIALKKPTKNVVLVAGILGIFFFGIVGGILTLVGMRNTNSKNNSNANVN